MCGIFGIISQTEPITDSLLQTAINTLDHRGPDGRGYWLSDDHKIGLAHARLSIIDLVTGQQPLTNEDRSIHLIVNGEFYDYQKLRLELQTRGHRFSTETDSEILLHLYEDFDLACLNYLRGEFAFILWDERKQRLFAARDRFGIKPLCYAQAGEKLYLASSAKAIFAAGLKPEWDQAAYYHAASLQYLPPDRTLFNNVSQLPPGHLLLCDRNGIKTQSYWDLGYRCEDETIQINSIADEQLLIEQFRTELETAVRLRLHADVPICCCLSGGLDSSAIVGLTIAQLQKPIDCFTVCFTDAQYDEYSIAAETAAFIGANLHPIRVSDLDIIEVLSDAVYYSEGLAINGHLSAKYLLNRAIHQAGYKVVLTGEGADEVVAGYPHLRRDLLLAADPSINRTVDDLYSSNSIMMGIQLPHGDSLSLENVKAQLGFIPSFLTAKGTFGLRVHSLLNRNYHGQFNQQDCYQLLLANFDIEVQLRGRHYVNQSLYLWTKTSLANYILKTLGDGTEMASAVEARLPFLDHHLFNFIRRLPLSLKIHNGVEKYILRAAVKDLLTTTVYQREKHPFTAPPLLNPTSAPVQEFVQDILRSAAFAHLPFFHQPAVLALLDRWPDMSQLDRQASDPVLMMLLTTYLIQQRFKL